MPQGPGGTRRRSRQGVPAVSGSGGGGTGQPTAIISDDSGLSDALVGTFDIKNESVGASDALAFTPGPTDDVGFSEKVSSTTATLGPADDGGLSDVFNLEVKETAQDRSGTPDTDSWGDGWVDRTVANAGTHQAEVGGVSMQVANAAAANVTEQDGYLEINFDGTAARGTPRLQGPFTAQVAGSTFVFPVAWPNVATTPAASLLVDFQTNAARPFVESTITANSQAKISSLSPFTQRSITFPQDGTPRRHTVTFTAAETTAILNGKWLLVQFSVAALTLGTFLLGGRHSAQPPTIDFFIQR